MDRFRLGRGTVRTGSLTSEERRELRKLEYKAERDREREARREAGRKEQEIRGRMQEQIHQGKRHSGGGKLLLFLIIIAAAAYVYWKYFR